MDPSGGYGGPGPNPGSAERPKISLYHGYTHSMPWYESFVDKKIPPTAHPPSLLDVNKSQQGNY